MSTEKNKQAQHKKRMSALKEKVDERIAAATDDKGLLLVLTGNGKGKSSSAFGMLTRATGHDMRCAAVQFIKGAWENGERNVLEKLGVPFFVMNTGFTWDTQDREADTAAAQHVWEQAKQLLKDPDLDVVLLDELTYMLTYQYLDLEEVVQCIGERPVNQHVIVTGRACHRSIMEMADTVSEVQSIKHAFDHGIKAQKGIDW